MARDVISRFLVPLAGALAFGQLSVAAAEAPDLCNGHQLLATPRPEAGCLTVKPQLYVSPDNALRAFVFPVDVDLHATPDMESRVVIRGPNAKLLASKDYSSPRGANGYYVVRAQWSPDSQFFVYSMSSSGGHSPWSFPIWVFSRERNAFISLNEIIGSRPTIAEDFSFSGPHTVTAVTVENVGSDQQTPVAVDLADATSKIAIDSEE
jgi:hypothetical protein